MCTLSFLPFPDGFALAMNRDEQLTRAMALPPERHACGAGEAIYPSEPDGGTWIGAHENGFAFALLNWYAHPSRPGRLSRGRLIPQLLAYNPTLTIHLAAIDLSRTNPFRLFSFIPVDREIREFRWNGLSSSTQNHPWEIAHWYSSAFDEPGVAAARAATTRASALEPDAGTLPWIRRLHASEKPEPGPYSIRMQRADARSVSYTELEFRGQKVQMRYTSDFNRLGTL